MQSDSEFMQIQKRTTLWTRSNIGAMTAAFLGMAGPVSAHHPMGGVAPRDAVQGVLSGLGHPVIGADHLLFLVVAALLTSVLRGRQRLMLSILASAAGFEMARLELLTAGSVALGGLVLAGGAGRVSWLSVFLGLAGFAHGCAYGEAVIGVEASPLLSYLAGCALVQGLLMLGISAAWIRWGRGGDRLLRLAGWGTAVGGIVLMGLAVS
jgi:urease accessory protein